MHYFSKKLSFIAAATGCALALQAAPALAETLTTGVDPTFSPMAMQNLKGGLEGFNVDLGHALAKEMGITIKIEPSQFSAIIPALNAGKYDFVLAPTTATEQRAQSLLFSEGYFNTDYTFVQKKSAAPVTDLAQLKGKTITVNSGSAYEAWAKANEAQYGFKYQVFSTTADAIQAVLSGLADAALIDNISGPWAAKKNPMLQTSYTIRSGKVFALVFRKDDVKGRDRLSNALKCLKKQGVVAGLVKKWLGTDPAPDAASVVIETGQGVQGLPGYDPTPAKYSCKS
ncbi:transporter substrate-binding domain-containing protein [Castellaniella sp.]|uniref:transporter substrate-binding domain-containing protein n=1 Tax=Castellaniella sp. TaxID=1955812 RepID=UPI003C78B046